VDRADGFSGHLHGSHGHLDCQCGPAPHRRQCWRRPERIDLGFDKLLDQQCHHPADQWLAGLGHGPEALLHELCGSVHDQLVCLRDRADFGHAPHLPNPARGRRRRPGSFRTGNPDGYVPGKTTRNGLCRLWSRGRSSSRDRTRLGRLDYGSLLLALDFLYQHPDWAAVAGPHGFAG